MYCKRVRPDLRQLGVHHRQQLRCAKKDNRVRVHNNEEFLDVIANHNHAFGLISSSAKYCKVVSGDDFIFPDCLRQMVELAEANPAAGIVGSYQQSGKRVRWQGFGYPAGVLAGRQVCREVFLSDQPDFGFGSPTSLLYRADLIRNNRKFYPNASPHADTSACFKELQTSDFGFVYQVLSYERIHPETQSYRSVQLNRYLSAMLNDVLEYGPACLGKEEYERLLKKTLGVYRRFLAINYFGKSQGSDFWRYHRGRLAELGYPLTRFQLIHAAAVTILREILNPERAVRKFCGRVFARPAGGVRAGQGRRAGGGGPGGPGFRRPFAVAGPKKIQNQGEL
jgi:hypothetical protein